MFGEHMRPVVRQTRSIRDLIDRHWFFTTSNGNSTLWAGRRFVSTSLKLYFFEQAPWNSRFAPAIMCAVVMAIDLVAGQSLRVSSFFVIPVLLAGWNCRTRCAIGTAVILCFWRLGLECFWNADPALAVTIFNSANRGVVLIALSIVTSILARNTRRLRDRVRVLEGLLPICCSCKSIRDEGGDWHRIERYIEDRSSAKFSHGFCPNCYENFMRSEGLVAK